MPETELGILAEAFLAVPDEPTRERHHIGGAGETALLPAHTNARRENERGPA